MYFIENHFESISGVLEYGQMNCKAMDNSEHFSRFNSMSESVYVYVAVKFRWLSSAEKTI